MTAPLPTELTEELEEQAVGLEEVAAALVVSTLAAETASASVEILRAFVTAPGSLVRNVVRRVFGRIVPRLQPPGRDAARDGLVLGLEQGERVAAERGGRVGEVAPPRDATLIEVISGMDDRARATLDDAVRMAEALPMETLDDVNLVLAKGRSAVNGARGEARWIVNQALGDGVEEVARSLGWNTMWVPERDACLHCLAYAGYVTAPGEEFPDGLTFGDRALTLPVGTHPPLHPNCRCRIEPYDGPAGPPDVTVSTPDVASALAKEARRSVLRGLTRHASEPAALRAADRLIKAGAALPKTVVARARRDVERGRFTSRPTGL